MLRLIQGFGALVLVACATTLSITPANAQLEFDTKAKFAVLMDHESGTILYQKNADAKMEPASMAKLMTIEVTLNMIRQDRLSLSDEFFISEFAWREGGASSGGSTMFAVLDSKVSVENLLRSVIIQSGNDASIALAEGIGGTELTFSRIMNERGEELGLTGSHFTNSTGLPDPDMRVTARDLANLARHIIREYQEYYHIFAEPSFEWNGIKQGNRNTLLTMGIGVDGLKTGHTESSGYGEVVSTTDGGRRLIAVLHGLTSIKERGEEARKLVTWGTRNFDPIAAFAKDQIISEIDVYGGAESKVGLVGDDAVSLYIPKGSKRCLSAEISYQAPILPPVERGAKLAELRIMCDGQLIQSAPLYAAESVEAGSIVRKATDALRELALGWL